MAWEQNGFDSLKIVFFDFGFTLWNEQRAWTHWAKWLGVPPLDFLAVLGSVIERGEHHYRAFDFFRPGIDLIQERRLRAQMGESDALSPEELYPDAIPCLTKLRAAGYRTGVAGNHFTDFANTLRKMNAPLDFIGSSEKWGVQKPSLEFFSHIVQLTGALPQEIAYVGDRLDNDVLPAKAAGMVSRQYKPTFGSSPWPTYRIGSLLSTHRVLRYPVIGDPRRVRHAADSPGPKLGRLSNSMPRQ